MRLWENKKKFNGVIRFSCLSSLCFLYMDLKVKTGRMDCTLKPGLHSCYAIKKLNEFWLDYHEECCLASLGPASPGVRSHHHVSFRESPATAGAGAGGASQDIPAKEFVTPARRMPSSLSPPLIGQYSQLPASDWS